VKNYFSIVAFQKALVSLENVNHFSGHHPLTPLRHFENCSLTVFLKKLKKEQFDCSYFCDSRYIYIYIHIEVTNNVTNCHPIKGLFEGHFQKYTEYQYYLPNYTGTPSDFVPCVLMKSSLASRRASNERSKYLLHT
jgi:hypothetical protein